MKLRHNTLCTAVSAALILLTCDAMSAEPDCSGVIATTENLVDYRPTPVSHQVFAMPLGLYTDELLVFLGDRIELANMILPRR